MIFVKLAFRNIKGKLNDYLIYLLTLTAFSALMLSAFMLNVFPAFSSLGDVFIVNSLPVMIALTLLCFMVYVNRFMLKRRSQELAIYMLSGITKNNISLLFFTEHIFLGIIALIVGLALGILIFWGILTVITASWQLSDVVIAILKTAGYFLIAHILSLGIEIAYLRRLEIKNLIYQRKQNEQRKVTLPRLLLSSFTTILFFMLFVFLVKYLVPQTVFIIAPVMGVVVYGFYTSIFGWAQWYRNQNGSLLYANRRLSVAGQCLSKIQSNMRVSAVVSGCLLTALFTASAGYVFVSGGDRFFEGQINAAMGFAQIYISIVFTIIVFAIVALRQIMENREHKENYIILKRLGTAESTLNYTLLQQIIINFTLPILAVGIIVLGCLHPLEQRLHPFFQGGNLITQGMLLYLSIFTILYTGYITLTYKSLKRTKEKRK